MLPPVTPGAADETAVLPAVGAADETAVLPPVQPAGAADETAVLPHVRDDAGAPADTPAERMPPGFFRDERAGGNPDGSDDRTRELPQVDADGQAPRRRPRPDWAEETPLDDLPSLADELLGSYEEPEHDDERGRRGRGRRG